MALYTYRQMPPTVADNIDGSAGSRAGQIVWKPSISRSARHYHRALAAFDARLELKPIATLR